jgi:RsiW-degrading membrane proteinase PrsW (M82 family)
MGIYASLQGAVFPIILYVILLWRLDKLDREPFLLVAGNFLWGAFGATAIAVTLSTLISSLFSLSGFITAVALAPVVEETAKGSILFLTIRSRKFSNMTDGLVYGGAVGCGFAMTENFFYYMAYGKTADSLVYLIIMRSVFSAVMHLVATASFGAFLSFYKFGWRLLSPFYILTALLLPIGIHSIWNYEVSRGSIFPGGLLFIGFIFLAFAVVFSLSLRKEKELKKEKLLEEQEQNQETSL